MAVRDDGPHDVRKQRKGPLPWLDALGYLPAILLGTGLFIYAYLHICYDRFYGGLGIDPNDVGLTYAGTLARSSGLVVSILLGVLIFSTPFVAVMQDTAEYRRKHPTSVLSRLVTVAVVIGALILLAGYLSGPMLSASEAAGAVRAGKPVRPIRIALIGDAESLSVFELPVLAIRADPATIESVAKPGDSPTIERLRGRRLLYLGQSGGTVVVYDPDAGGAVYLPANSIILHAANCDMKPPKDMTCLEVRSY